MKNYKDKLVSIVQNFSHKKILVIGDLMLDEYWYGASKRLSPEAPVPVVEIKKITRVPGGAANTAFNVRSLGDETFLVGVIGDDENGDKLKTTLKKAGINTRGVLVDKKRPTTVKSRIVCQGQHLVRLDKESKEPITVKLESQLYLYIKKNIDESDVVLLSDYAKGVLTENLIKKIIKLAKKYKKRIIIGPKGDDFSKYSGATVVIPNLKETEQALKINLKNVDQIPQLAKMLLAHVDSSAVLVTLSEHGMCLVEREGRCWQIPAPTTKVIDISGAGDTAIASFTLSLASGATMREATTIASFACGIVISKIGTAQASRKELIEAILENQFKLPLSP